ncbi:MAG: hypothetical protein MJ094_01065 [Saccharofermentans sp.]|nr:hypothetical protein [Saccharofermentans sp.]
MTLEEAKKLYFDNGCNTYTMYHNCDLEEYSEFNKAVTPEKLVEFELEYLPLAFDEIYEKKAKSGYVFLRIAKILERRNAAYSKYALRLVEVFEECPFTLDDQALMVAEWMLGINSQRLIFSGMAILQFYDDYADRIKASLNKYLSLQFSSEVVTMFDMKPYPASKLNERVEALGKASMEVYEYVKSSKLDEDYSELQKKTSEFKADEVKDRRKMILIMWAAILGTALVIGLLSWLVYLIV